MVVLDSGGLSRLCERSRAALALLEALRDGGLWPPIVPSPVLVECLTPRGLAPDEGAAGVRVERV